MTDQVIPAGAVEAAAKKLAGARHGLWELTPEPKRRLYLRDARLALEAAAPYMLGEAWKEGEAAGQDNAYAYQIGIAVKSNPYRTIP